MTLALATWNVLHRVHAVNWNEPIGIDEPARIAAITARIAASHVDVWCLQEVSGDQLAALRGALGDAQVQALVYPRVPKLHRPGVAAPLADPTEHLVTIVRTGQSRVVHAAAFATDHGKGALAIELSDGALLINTHVTYGDKHREQCEELAAMARAARGIAVVAGDFNADLVTILAALGAEFDASRPGPTALPTRPRTGADQKAQTIDHIIVRNGAGLSATVEDASDVSDHNPVFGVIGS